MYVVYSSSLQDSLLLNIHCYLIQVMQFKLLSAQAVQSEKAQLVICQSGMLICLRAGSLAKMLPKPMFALSCVSQFLLRTGNSTNGPNRRQARHEKCVVLQSWFPWLPEFNCFFFEQLSVRKLHFPCRALHCNDLFRRPVLSPGVSAVKELTLKICLWKKIQFNCPVAQWELIVCPVCPLCPTLDT